MDTNTTPSDAVLRGLLTDVIKNVNRNIINWRKNRACKQLSLTEVNGLFTNWMVRVLKQSYNPTEVNRMLRYYRPSLTLTDEGAIKSISFHGHYSYGSSWLPIVAKMREIIESFNFSSLIPTEEEQTAYFYSNTPSAASFPIEIESIINSIANYKLS